MTADNLGARWKSGGYFSLKGNLACDINFFRFLNYDQGCRMLLCTLYHNINADKYSNRPDIFERHLLYIKKHFRVVFPGDCLGEKNICLTFDDGYFNFYKYVYPLLKKNDMKAILAVPTKFILEKTSKEEKKRLSVRHDDAVSYYKDAPFCTFEELKEMSESGCVKIASHTHSHANLTNCEDVSEELLLSRDILEKKLGIVCDTFMFPYGKYNDEIARKASEIYPYLFRIGNAINKDFNGIKGVIYRIDADNLKDEKDIFSFRNMTRYKMKSFLRSFCS